MKRIARCCCRKIGVGGIGAISAIMVSLVPAWQAECDARRQSMALGLGRIMPTTWS